MDFKGSEHLISHINYPEKLNFQEFKLFRKKDDRQRPMVYQKDRMKDQEVARGVNIGYCTTPSIIKGSS